MFDLNESFECKDGILRNFNLFDDGVYGIIFSFKFTRPNFPNLTQVMIFEGKSYYFIEGNGFAYQSQSDFYDLSNSQGLKKALHVGYFSKNLSDSVRKIDNLASLYNDEPRKDYLPYINLLKLGSRDLSTCFI